MTETEKPEFMKLLISRWETGGIHKIHSIKRNGRWLACQIVLKECGSLTRYGLC